MGANTKIEWTDHSWNPWVGCTKVSPGCDNCYAERLMDTRMHKVQWGAGQPRVRTSEENWIQPLRWNARAKREGRRCKVFCASLADVFDNEVPEEWRADLFDLIRRCENLDFLLLTKRVGNVPGMVRAVARRLGGWPHVDTMPVPLPANVWLGATVVDQPEADRDIPKLLAVPAAKRFLSMEPLLSAVDIGCAIYPDNLRMLSRLFPRETTRRSPMIDWVIVGGESGPGARPMHVSWARSIVQQCKAAGVPVFVKQLGAQPRGWCAGIAAADDPESNYESDYCEFYEAHEIKDPCRGRCAFFCHPKGASPLEWPADLRVREVPA